METKGIDTVVKESCAQDAPVDELLRMQRQLAGYRYRFAEVVADLSKKAMQAEVDRKSVFAKAKLMAKAEAVGSKVMSESAASDVAEQRPEVIRARHDEIDAQGMYEAAKLKMHASGDVLMSLTMRISYAKEEAKNTRSISTHEPRVTV